MELFSIIKKSQGAFLFVGVIGKNPLKTDSVKQTKFALCTAFAVLPQVAKSP